MALAAWTRWAVENNLPVRFHYAEWKLDGRAAGPLRNQRMVDAADALVLLHRGGNGSQDVLRRARKKGIEIVMRSYGQMPFGRISAKTADGEPRLSLHYPQRSDEGKQP